MKKYFVGLFLSFILNSTWVYASNSLKDDDKEEYVPQTQKNNRRNLTGSEKDELLRELERQNRRLGKENSHLINTNLRLQNQATKNQKYIASLIKKNDLKDEGIYNLKEGINNLSYLNWLKDQEIGELKFALDQGTQSSNLLKENFEYTYDYSWKIWEYSCALENKIEHLQRFQLELMANYMEVLQENQRYEQEAFEKKKLNSKVGSSSVPQGTEKN